MGNFNKLQRFFQNYQPTSEAVRLSECETILNQAKFIETHLAALRANSGNARFMPYYKRLMKFYNIVRK